MSKVTKNYLYNLLYQLFVLIVPIITAPYLARTLGANSQGISSYIISMANILSTITLLGIYNYGNRQIAYERDNREKMSQTFWEIMSIRLLLAIIGSIIYIVIACILSKFTRYFFIYYIWMIAVYLDCTWVYVGVEDMKPAVIKNFIAKLITVLGIFIAVRDNSDIDIYLLLMGGSVFIANMLSYTQLKKYVNKPKINISKFKIHLKGSIKMFLPTVATLIYLQVGKVMIEFFTAQTSQVSFYDNSEKIVTIPLTFITVLSTVMMPRIANEFIRGNNNKIIEYVQKAGIISIFFAMPMTLGVIVISPKFVPWYLGSEYMPVINGIIIIAPIIIGNSMEGISGRQYFVATNQIGILTKAYSITAIVNIIINIIMIPKYGFLGAAIATVISSYICVLIQFYYLRKQIQVKCFILYGIKYLMYSIIMSIVVIILTYNMRSTFITTIIQIIIGAIIYFGIAYITRDHIFKFLINKILRFSIKRY